jgi:aspartate aminotransferase
VPLPSLARVPAPPDSILGLAEAYRNDPRPDKVNLSAGVFVDETGKTPMLKTVIEAERRLADAAATKLYRPIDGEVAYREAVRALALGRDHEAVTSGRALATQTPGGTGGLRVAADLLRQTGASETLWMSEPTWPNHPQLFHAAGFKLRSYPYTDATGRHIDEDAMLAALGEASPGDIVLLHGACHNPTGVDPSPDLWRRIGDLVEERRVLPLVDLAYQGFGDGLFEDAAGLHELVRPGAELLVSTSFSKTFSLYSERVGAILVIARSAADANAVQSHVKAAIRVNYSNPPAHGADIVRTILADSELRAQWEVELAGMRARIKANRRALVGALESRGIPGDWGGIATQRGMFALLGLSAHQVAQLKDEHGVYVVGKGRINVAGFTPSNLETFADALGAVIAAGG